MKTLTPLIALLLASPAVAQDSWPVAREGSVCSASRGGSPTSDSLIITYDPARQQVLLQTAVETEGGTPGSGKLELAVVFDKGAREGMDIGWGIRQFAYTHRDNRLDLNTAFAGRKNADQLFADLAGSRRLGLVRESKTVADFDLAGIAPAIAQLKECAANSP